MQYRTWIAGFLRHLGAVAVGLAAGALVSFGVIRHAQYVSEDTASIMAAVFPALIGGYVAGRLARRWSVLWAFLVSVPLSLFWGGFMGDVETPETVCPLILAAGIVGGFVAAFRSPKARWIADRGLVLVALVYAFWCFPPIAMTAWRYHTFRTTTFPRIVRELDGKMLTLPGKPAIHVTPTYRVFYDDEPGWVLFAGSVGKVRVSGWLDRPGRKVVGLSFIYAPDPHTTDLESARDYLKRLGMKLYLARALEWGQGIYGSEVVACGLNGTGDHSFDACFDKFEQPVRVEVQAWRDGRAAVVFGAP